MTGPLLRTGSLKAFHPLGAVGNPVYLAAAQLRAAISRRLGSEVVNTFAVPQRNEDGDTIDWYAPEAGPVVPWSAATPNEQAEAKARLLEVRERIEGLARTMQAEQSTERQVFGRLLEHVTLFPSDEHLYLVNDRPVVTFWGFLENDAPVGTDPLLNLPILDPQPERRGRRIPWWVWLLPLLLLLGLLYLLWRAWQEPPPEPPVSASQPGVAEPPVEAPAAEALPARAPDEPIAEPAAQEPPATSEPPLPEEPGEDRPPDRVRLRGARTHTTIQAGRTATGVETLDTTLAPGAAMEGETVLETDTTRQEEVSAQPGEVTAGEAAVAVDEDTADLSAAADLAPETEPVPETPNEGSPTDTAVDATEQTTEVSSEAAEVTESPVEAPPEAPTEELQPAAGEQVAPAEAAGAETPPPEGPGEAPEIDQPSETDTLGAQRSPPPPDVQTEAQTEAPGQPQPTGAEPGISASGAPAAKPGQAGATDAARSPASQGASATRGTIGIPTARLINSGWRTRTTLQDPRTGLPVKLEYQLRDGAGRVELKRADGSACVGDVKAAVEGRNLVIDSTGNIVCPDGTNFGRPRLECRPGKDGRADCRGRYPSGETFSVDITQQKQ